MIKYIASIWIAVFLPQLLSAQIDILTARNEALGTEVTVQGIVTNGAELGTIRYMQDGTAGIAAFPGNNSVNGFGEVEIGDRIIITGELSEFRGLLEISPISSFEILSRNNTLPEPKEVLISQLTDENESQLVKINNVQFENPGNDFEGDASHRFFSGSNDSNVFLRSNNSLVGTEIPSDFISLTAIASVYNQSQLLPRGLEDLENQLTVFSFSTSAKQEGIQRESVTIAWSTTMAADKHGIDYGLDEGYGETVFIQNNLNSAEIEVANLEPNTFYYMLPWAELNGQRIQAAPFIASTGSTSSGEIQIYFNHDVDDSFTNGSSPNGDEAEEMESAIINFISKAEKTLDLCLYNNDRPEIVNAINQAVDKGVRVRYIANEGTANAALGQANQKFEPIFVNPFKLMHNKFMIADVESVEKASILTGSTNITENNIEDDFNNTIIIQDITLAKAYTLEFEEMWGSDTMTPDLNQANAGSNKSNNTPHLFLVNEVKIENYFSPSDNTTRAIINAIETADREINFALLSFTRDDIGQALIEKHKEGILIRGMIESINDQSGEYPRLVKNGIAVRPHAISNQLHHKYCIIDANDINSDPMLITGSHNWSNAAERDNDENTLIIHNIDVANVYLQEFEKRWSEVPTSNHLILNDARITAFPNPSKKMWLVNFNAALEVLHYELWDAQGKNLRTNKVSSNSFQVDAKGLNAGIYYLKLITSRGISVKKLVKQ